MSAYSTYTSRRPTESTPPSSSDKLKVEKLQELFSTWSNEDLQSVLTETAGDVELAVARISEGHAEQWGSVTRKKDKKSPQPSQPSSTPVRGDRERPGDFRGARGGRGGRGRGGGGRGGSRGAHPSGPHREAGAPSSVTNGVAVPLAATTPSTNKDESTHASASPTTSSKEGDAEKRVNGVGVGAHEARAKPTPDDAHPSTPAPAEPPVASTSEAGRAGGSSTDPITPTTRAVGASAPDTKGSASPVNGLSEVAKAKVQLKTSKIPSGTKLSWAQIARPQDKPQPVAPPPPAQPPAPPAASSPTDHVPPSFTEDMSLPQDQQGREEPTTVQPPNWDDEPPSLPPQAPEPQISTNDGWITADTVPPSTVPPDAWKASTTFSAQRPEPIPQDSTWNQTSAEDSPSIPSPQVTTSSVASIAPTTTAASATTSTAPTSKPSTPSVSHASARPTTAHRTSARYLKSDQAVVIPAFAGSIGAVGEKLGMQFGSLSIGGEDTFDSFKSETEQPAPNVSETLQQPPHAPQTQMSTQTQSQETVPSTVGNGTTHSQNFFPQTTQPTQAVTTPAQQLQSPSQPSQSQQQPAGPPFGSHPPPPALSHQQQQQQIAQHQPHQQHQQQHSYVQQQQHGVHAQFDGPPAAPHQQQQHPQQSQHASGPQSGSYFRQPESPYYHNPTPPQSAPPEHQGAYGTTFSPLGVGAGAHTHAQGLGGQGQGAHVGGFGAGGPGEYGYGDGQRGFYDYAQPGSFSNRLVHDEPSKGGLPISQASQPASSLNSATGQTQASNGPQNTSAQPPAGQQGQQQQGYPAPMPYYYPPYYPQNSYPTYPNPSYGQAYMPKYPPVYPHQAPVAPGAGPPPSGKGPSATAPYSTTTSQSHLYHGQGGFEDPTAGYQQGSTNLGNTEYQKQPPHHQQQQQPLYGAQAAQGLQSFLGIQQTPGSGQSVGGPGGQQRSGTSPEAPYKPYGAPGGASDKGGVGLGAQPGQQGRAASVQQSQQQGGGAASFYPGGRFSGGGAGPQQQGQQQGQGYPQGGDQGQFYPYQPRHQGGYWQ